MSVAVIFFIMDYFYTNGDLKKISVVNWKASTWTVMFLVMKNCLWQMEMSDMDIHEDSVLDKFHECRTLYIYAQVMV